MAGLVNYRERQILKQTIVMRSVFIPIRSGIYRRDDKDDNLVVDIHDDEWVINVESVGPNPSIGPGTRIWVGRLSDA